MYESTKNYSLGHNARSNFVKKVYSIISLQLLVTVGAIILNITSTAFAYVQATYRSLFWLSFLITFGSMLALCNIF
jgi:FtsH-binding integral membrane protein